MRNLGDVLTQVAAWAAWGMSLPLSVVGVGTASFSAMYLIGFGELSAAPHLAGLLCLTWVLGVPLGAVQVLTGQRRRGLLWLLVSSAALGVVGAAAMATGVIGAGMLTIVIGLLAFIAAGLAVWRLVAHPEAASENVEQTTAELADEPPTEMYISQDRRHHRPADPGSPATQDAGAHRSQADGTYRSHSARPHPAYTPSSRPDPEPEDRRWTPPSDTRQYATVDVPPPTWQPRRRETYGAPLWDDEESHPTHPGSAWDPDSAYTRG